jgi:hypothetical protein
MGLSPMDSIAVDHGFESHGLNSNPWSTAIESMELKPMIYCYWVHGAQTHDLLLLSPWNSNAVDHGFEFHGLNSSRSWVWVPWTQKQYIMGLSPMDSIAVDHGFEFHGLNSSRSLLSPWNSNPWSTAIESMELKPMIYCYWVHGTQTHDLLLLSPWNSNPWSGFEFHGLNSSRSWVWVPWTQ